MMKRSLVKLGKLKPEEKEKVWAESISGSQAWMLINEPYNLLRDKLGVERIHKSKYDFFNSNKFKTISANAMACGTLYEEAVFNYEVKPAIQQAIRDDETFKLFLFDSNGTKLEKLIITATPDYYVKQDDTYILVGDIKCSTEADNEEKMLERYKWQALHNCYVLNCKDFELSAKGNITAMINKYTWVFSQDDFEWYEKKLLEFYYALAFNDVEAYDHLYKEQQEEKTQSKEILIKPLVEYDAQADEAETLENYFIKKQQLKQLEAEVKQLEEFYKSNYDNLKINFNNKVFEIKASERVGTIDYTKAIKEICEKYNFPKTEFDVYRKPATLIKTITIK